LLPYPESQDRRREVRSLCSNLAEIAFHDQTGRLVRQQALVEDVSANGVCISSSLPVSAGARVVLHADGFIAEGQVRYCQLGDYSFLIGLEFEPEHGPASSEWRPRHLLNAHKP
jgi:hypothetical protein